MCHPKPSSSSRTHTCSGERLGREVGKPEAGNTDFDAERKRLHAYIHTPFSSLRSASPSSIFRSPRSPLATPLGLGMGVLEQGGQGAESVRAQRMETTETGMNGRQGDIDMPRAGDASEKKGDIDMPRAGDASESESLRDAACLGDRRVPRSRAPWDAEDKGTEEVALSMSDLRLLTPPGWKVYMSRSKGKVRRCTVL
jgi:hypothetical protein